MSEDGFNVNDYEAPEPKPTWEDECRARWAIDDERQARLDAYRQLAVEHDAETKARYRWYRLEARLWNAAMLAVELGILFALLRI
jgi:hypothetical protein